MPTPVKLLQLSPTMSEGTIVRWLVKEGDAVKSGDIIAEIETDKAVMEQESFEDGVMIKLIAPEGSAVKVGSDIAMIGAAGEKYVAGASAPSPAPAAPAAPAKPAAPAAKTPSQGDDDPIVKSPNTPPRVNFAPVAPAAEKESQALARMGQGHGAGGAVNGGGRVVASPLARKMASDQGIDLQQVAGSGPGNRIIKRDIEAAVAGGGTSRAAAPAAPAAKPAAKSAPLPVVYAPGAPDEEVALSGMRKTIARRLVESRTQVPSFNLTVEVDAEPILYAVERLRETMPDDKITVTHFLIKAMASTVMRHPWVRTQWVDGKLIRKNSAHISVAVAIEDGLLTPVIRDAQFKGLVHIARELRELAGRARDRKLTEADLTGGVQTLSNLGMYGIRDFDAIINPPESTILAVGGVVEKPVVIDGDIVPGKTFTITMACDHRVVDGAVGAQYLKDLKAVLEEPVMMLV